MEKLEPIIKCLAHGQILLKIHISLQFYSVNNLLMSHNVTTKT